MRPRANVRLDIQGLRALAVILVIVNHASESWLPGGFIGVDVFFVISGFIITSTLVREWDATKRISFTNFYIRRIKRILPAGLLVIAVTVAVAALLLPAERAQSTAVDGIWAALFAGNWHLIIESTDYFAGGLTPSPLQHYWSLSIEEQFYFIWPWLMLAVLQIAGHRTRAAEERGRRSLIVIIGAVILLSFIWALLQTATNPSAAYFSSFTRFWELGAGALAAIALSPITRGLRPTVAAASTFAGIGIILGSAFALSSSTPFPGWAALLPVTGALLVVVGGHAQGETYVNSVLPLTNRVSVYLGNISYSLYLWHFPVLILLYAVLPVGRRYYALAFGATLLLSALSYRFVETPFRRLPWGTAAPRNARPVWEKGAVLATTAALVACCVAAPVALASRAAGTQTAATGTVSEATQAMIDRCRGAGSLDTANQPCDPAEIPLAPSLDAFQNDVGSDEDLACRRGEHDGPVVCNIGDPAADYRIAIVGDSHMGNYLGMLRALALKNDWSVTTYIGWSCQWTPHPAQDCGTQIEQANADFTDGTPYDVIISTSARQAMAKVSDATLRGSQEMMSAAVAAGNRVVQIEDVPIPSEESLLCLQRPGIDPQNAECSTPRDAAFSTPDVLTDAAREVDGVEIVSFNDLVCPEGSSCPAISGGTVVFRDTVGHLTVTYTNTLESAFVSRILPDAPVLGD